MIKRKTHFQTPRGTVICGQSKGARLRTLKWEEVTCGNCHEKKPKKYPLVPETVPMSVHRPFDNQNAWLEDEPWRTW